MIVKAPNWRGTAINAIRGTRGLSGRCCRGMGQDASSGGPDIFTQSEIAGLVPPVGPNANVVAPLQVGTLAQQISSSGQYSLSPSSGQLVTNWIPGVSNSTLLIGGAAVLGFVLVMGMARGRR